jgi:hypothetical protein
VGRKRDDCFSLPIRQRRGRDLAQTHRDHVGFIAANEDDDKEGLGQSEGIGSLTRGEVNCWQDDGPEHYGGLILPLPGAMLPRLHSTVYFIKRESTLPLRKTSAIRPKG